MNDKKQTAVKWLISELSKSKDFHRVINELNQKGSGVRHILNEALQMEKKQSIENMDKMQIINDVDFDGNVTFVFNPEQYYKETYER